MRRVTAILRIAWCHPQATHSRGTMRSRHSSTSPRHPRLQPPSHVMDLLTPLHLNRISNHPSGLTYGSRLSPVLGRHHLRYQPQLSLPLLRSSDRRPVGPASPRPRWPRRIRMRACPLRNVYRLGRPREAAFGVTRMPDASQLRSRNCLLCISQNGNRIIIGGAIRQSDDFLVQ